MKRCIPLIFFILLLLCGCASKEAVAPTTAATVPTEPAVVDTYVSGTQVETDTEGAVRQYNLDAAISWIKPLDDGVLTASVDEQTVLTVISGENGRVIASITVPAKLADTDCQIIPKYIAYYDSTANQVVFLDTALKEMDRLQLPANITGAPAIAPNGTAVYYCVGEAINAIDVAHKTVRPVRNNTCKEQTLLGCYLESSVVACRVLDTEDVWSTIYINGTDGQLLYKEDGIEKLDSNLDSYFVQRKDGIVHQYIYEKIEESSQPVQINITAQSVFGALELGGIVAQEETEEAICLSLYNLKKTATVMLPKDQKIAQVAADPAAVWLLTENGALLRWDPQKTAVTEETEYTSPVFTAKAPDSAGIKACTKRGDEIGKKHGVVIRIWDKALSGNDDYKVEPEYQTAAINKTLDELVPVLNMFPSKFVYKSVNGRTRICIVRSVGGEQKSAYHWKDGAPFIVISAGMDVKKAFLEAFAYIVDTHILGNTSRVDSWGSLNPEDFQYGMENPDAKYLEGDTRAFVDEQAMQTVTDDRARTFLAAMEEGNEDLFKTEIMQKKLLLLCRGIRDAWGLKKSTEIFPWEQYLTEPIAYKKK